MPVSAYRGLTYAERPRFRAYMWRRYDGVCVLCGGCGRCARCAGEGSGYDDWSGEFDCDDCAGSGACQQCGRTGWTQFWYWRHRRGSGRHRAWGWPRTRLNAPPWRVTMREAR